MQWKFYYEHSSYLRIFFFKYKNTQIYKLLTQSHKKVYSVIYLDICSSKINRNIPKEKHKIKFKGHFKCKVWVSIQCLIRQAV